LVPHKIDVFNSDLVLVRPDYVLHGKRSFGSSILPHDTFFALTLFLGRDASPTFLVFKSLFGPCSAAK
jgi:hypothetical protein